MCRVIKPLGLGFWGRRVVARLLVLPIRNYGGQGKDGDGVIGWGHGGCFSMAWRELGWAWMPRIVDMALIRSMANDLAMDG